MFSGHKPGSVCLRASYIRVTYKFRIVNKRGFGISLIAALDPIFPRSHAINIHFLDVDVYGLRSLCERFWLIYGTKVYTEFGAHRMIVQILNMIQKNNTDPWLYLALSL